VLNKTRMWADAQRDGRPAPPKIYTVNHKKTRQFIFDYNFG